MENSQLKDLQEEVSEATKQYILTTFNSENGMKTYYLQMSNIIRSAHINPPIDTEYNSLKKLSKKLKQYCTFIQTLGEHEWDKGIADIQKALGIYLMQNNIESKERKQTNQEIASQLQFIVFLSGNINIIKQLHGILQRHLSNVMLLLSSYPEHNIGSVVILGGLSLVNSLHAYTFASLKRKKLISTTPLNDALNALILALNASAAAFVLLFTKKFRILS